MSRADAIAAIFPRPQDVPEAFRLPAIEQRRYLVGGEDRQWDGPVEQVLSPVCLRTDGGSAAQQVLGHFPQLGEAEALAALDAAVRAYDNGRGAWPTMSVAERIAHVEQFIFRMQEKRDEVVNLLMWEIGKPLSAARKEFDRTIEYVRDTLDAVKELDRASSRFTIAQGVIAQIRRAPLGVVLCMGPYNYPLNETFTTLIPALIMGNTVIFKPARFGVLLHEPLLDAFRDCFPAGVVNTVYGDGKTVIGPLMASGKINVLAFIGSSRVANILGKQHPKPNRLRSVLGLEAKNAAIVLPHCDLEATVTECLLGSLSYSGQRCTALKLLFVHRDVHEAFCERFCAGLDALKIGMPWQDANITPLPEPGKSDYLRGLVDDAVAKGARVLNSDGGTANGTFFYPAALSPVSDAMRVFHEEQFGPVVPIVPFDDVATPIRFVEESDYGQQVALFGTDADELARLIDPLVNQVCRVNLNSQCQRGPDVFPFTGRKDSAEGTLSVSDALRVFAIRTLVAAKEGELNKELVTKIVREHKSKFLSTDFIL